MTSGGKQENIEAFETMWDRLYPGSVPISHTLPGSERDRWERLHSLPESKRYPESDKEMNVVLSRQNTIAQEVLGEGSACWLVTRMAVFGEGSNPPPEPQATVDLTEEYLPFVRRVPDTDDPDSEDDEYWDVFATVVVWSGGRWDHLLKLIARYRETCFWMSCDTGNIFAPYDGGIDIIMPDKARLAALKTRHAAWLAP